MSAVPPRPTDRLATIGVVDVGSNTIKSLLAARLHSGGVETLHREVEEVRISRGLWESGSIQPGPFAEALAAVGRLTDRLRARGAEQVSLLATSAVRDASNGAAFAAAVQSRTGIALEIISGEQEAAWIGRGLRCDPSLRDWSDFLVLDLGGGSLEVLSFRGGACEHAVSLPLGCVRLAARHHPDGETPLPAGAAAAVAEEVSAALGRCRFAKVAKDPIRAAAAGGTFAALRALAGHGSRDTGAYLPREELVRWLGRLAPLDGASRRNLPGMPAARADVLPVALATVLAACDHLGLPGFTHSFYSLRHGVADERLPRPAAPAP